MRLHRRVAVEGTEFASLAAEMTNVSVVVGTTQILSDVSLSVSRGDVIGLFGPSGSGKSTLLHTLGGLVVPVAGSVSIAGERVDTLTPADRAALRLRHIGFVFQFGHLIPELTALQNVALVPRLVGVSRREASEAAMGLLGSLGMAQLADRRPGELSGGELQRVAVARALAGDPSIVLADEPTGALDTENGHNVVNLLFDLVADIGCALIIASHDVSVIARTDRVVRLGDGRTHE